MNKERGFSSCILKLTSVCNLNCSYCYMFNLADKTFERVPNMMPLEVAIKAVDRICQHAIDLDVKRFSLCLHGGEPTMWPYENFVQLLKHIRHLNSNSPDFKLDVSVQSNGYRIDKLLLHLLAENNIGLGISIDGPKIYNDRFRVDHSGRGSYERILVTIETIISLGYQHILGGFLTVAQPEMPPKEFWNWIMQLPVKNLDILWPIDFHYQNPPWGNNNHLNYAKNPRYGRWFVDLFDIWWNEDNPKIYIRTFFETIESMLGSSLHTDNLVNDVLNMFVVNTDGAIEYPDYFRACKDGGSKTKYSVQNHSIDELVNDPIFSYCLSLKEHLPLDCLSCSQKEICGGGFLPGRMSHEERIPTRKSVLCADQLFFFSHVSNVMQAAMYPHDATDFKKTESAML